MSHDIERFNNVNINRVHRRINEVLADLSTELGVTIKSGRLTFYSHRFAVKLTGELGTEHDVITRRIANVTRRAGLTDVTEGVRFTSQGTDYTLVDARPKNNKYPLIGMDRNGKRWKFSTRTVQLGIGILANPLADF